MLSLVVSTIVFFAASYYTRRYLDDMQIPQGMTRSIVIFCLALGIAYAVAFAVDWLFPFAKVLPLLVRGKHRVSLAPPAMGIQ